MKNKLLLFLIYIPLFAGCTSSNEKRTASNPRLIKKVKKKVVGLSDAQVAAIRVKYYRRGIRHGQGIAIANMLVSTRSFDVLWETVIQNLPNNPSLVPYLRGFLDSVSGTVKRASEERRAASNTNYSPRLPLPREQANEQIRNRCLLVLARMVPLAQDPEMGGKLIPESIKAELRDVMDRELKTTGAGERRKNIMIVKNFVKVPESVSQVLRAFNEALVEENWSALAVAMNALKGSRDEAVRASFLKALKALNSRDDQAEPGLCGALLRSAADISVGPKLLSLATRATLPTQAFDVRNAGLYCLGRFSQTKSLRNKALELLANKLFASASAK